ncbi:MAG: TauD/TfdA family dioxygenase [Alphaproteobacteria bacterium]|nr:MAG: TauD/TfdA family dioxygenase [Alphaproteobacteria bacterium]
MINVTPSGEACGAEVTGVDFSHPIDAETLRDIRRAWIDHKVLAFPDQHLSDQDLERVTLLFGKFGAEPYFETIEGSQHVVNLCRRADETAPVFAEAWHSDWSFQKDPPIGTCLYSLVIPPVGGNTGFANQEMALEKMPADLRARLEGKTALHSAAAAYAPEGVYGEKDKETDRSLKIVYSETAREVFPHPFIMTHPESGKEVLFGCAGYIMGVEGMGEEEARSLIMDLYAWQTREEFQYTHKWRENMLVIWDNRAVLHRAYGGYDGYARELHRTTIKGNPEQFLRAG